MTAYFHGAKGSWIWLTLRLYIGYQWLTGGWHKIVDPNGFSSLGFLKGAAAKALPASPGAKPIVQGWYADFLNGFAIPNYKVFDVIIPWGELLVGLALILGFATIFAATMGIAMNLNYLLAGANSNNPNYLAIQILIVSAGGAYAGYLGLDQWFRPVYRKFVDEKVWSIKTQEDPVNPLQTLAGD
jgi:thiosulfate dehydrogenase [quinone] large subunit